MRSKSAIAAFAVRVVFVASVAALLQSCFAVSDLERFEIECTGNTAETRDFNFEVTSLAPHRGQLFELKVLRVAPPEVPDGPRTRVSVAAVVYDGVDPMNPIVAGSLRNALAPGEYETRFWAAFGGSRTFVFPGADHSWTVTLPANGCFAFEHGPPFDADITPTDDPTRRNVTLTLINVGDSAGAPLFWRVSDGNVDVGLYRLDALPTAVDDRVMTLPDIAIDDRSYTVVAFIDTDRSNDRSASEPQFTTEPAGSVGDVAFTLDLSRPD